MYSNTLTTFCTPPVVRAISTASVGFLAGHHAQQIDHAVFGHHLDMIGLEFAWIDKRTLTLEVR